MFSFGFADGGVAYAADPKNPSEGLYGLQESGERFGAKEQNLPVLIGEIISVALQLLGVIFVIIVVYAGFQWMLAEGDSGKIGDARGMIFHAVVGLVITMSAYAITRFVIMNISSRTIQ